MTWDGVIFWYEGLILFIAYFLYFTIQFQNPRISKHVKAFVARREERKLAKQNIQTNGKSDGIIVAVGYDNPVAIEEPEKKYPEPPVQEEKVAEKVEEQEEEGRLTWSTQ